MADEPTLWDVLDAFARRTSRMTRYSTKTEIADELGHERSAVDPLVDEAFKRCYLDEDPPYKCFWALNDAGRERLDAPIFNASS